MVIFSSDVKVETQLTLFYVRRSVNERRFRRMLDYVISWVGDDVG